jgi:hypothetical protein
MGISSTAFSSSVYSTLGGISGYWARRTPVRFKLPQRFCQHRIRDAGQLMLQRVIAQRSAPVERAHDGDFPFSADKSQRMG